MILIIMVYFIIGIVVAGVLNGDDPGDTMIIEIIFWPILLAGLIVFGLVGLCYKFGVIIRKLFFKD